MTEGYAIRYASKEFVKNNQGEDVPKEMGYVKSPSIYPEPLAKAIVSLTQSTEYEYHVFWVPNFEIIEFDVKRIELSYQEVDWFFLKKLPDAIGEITDPVIGSISMITDFYDHGTDTANLKGISINTLDLRCPQLKHFLIDKSWI